MAVISLTDPINSRHSQAAAFISLHLRNLADFCLSAQNVTKRSLQGHRIVAICQLRRTLPSTTSCE